MVHADTELYAGRTERRNYLRQQKGFDCACVRCVAPPQKDASLDGWLCQVSGCEGVVGEGDHSCAICAAAHALAPPARASIERRWTAAIDEATAGLHGGRGSANVVPTGQNPRGDSGSCEAAMAVVERVLSQSSGKLHEHHALRNKARRLKVYALPAGSPPAVLVLALEGCLSGLTLHLPRGHPETAFFQHWLARALSDEAASHPAGSALRKRLRLQARHASNAATEGLTISYGADHPFVHTWRASDAERDKTLL